MKLAAYHDVNGNIIGLAVSPSEDSIPAEVTSNTQPGLRMSILDAPPGQTLDFDNPVRLSEELTNLAKNYCIDTGVLKRKS